MRQPITPRQEIKAGDQTAAAINLEQTSFGYQVYLMLKSLRCFAVFVTFASTSLASDFLQPNPKYSPREVVEIQLRALQQNDDPVPGAGIAQTWAFAHPNNRVTTGPLAQFQQMIESANYRFLLGHVNHKIELVVETAKMALFQVSIVSNSGGKYSLNWRVLKALEGPFTGAWMTIGVSTPQRAGEAV